MQYFATASAALKRIENALGVELFIRSNAPASACPVRVNDIFPSCEQALAHAGSSQARTSEDDLDIVDGELRITLSSDLGRNLAIPWLDEFMDDLSQCQPPERISAIATSTFIAIPWTLPYATAHPMTSNLYGFKICNVPVLLVCVTQAYLDTARHSQTPS